MTTANITERAMLVNVNISMWSARRYDSTLSNEITTKHNAASDTARVNKLLVSRAAIKAVEQAASAVRTYHREQTLPWLADGARILPSANYFDYMDGLRPLRNAFDAAVQQFIADYPELVKAARTALNGMFRDEDYPHPSQIHQRFNIDVAVMPVPAADDFRVQLSEDEQEQIKQEISTRVEQAFKDATGDLVSRIIDSMQRVSERLRLYNVTPEGKVQNPFRDSLVTNVRDLIELLPRLNVTGDPQIARAVDELRAVAQYDPEVLREDDTLRVATAKRADKVLDTMRGYYGGM